MTRAVFPNSRNLLAALLALALAPTVRADDVWVDSVHGDDANGGSGPSDAWATITHALNQLGPVPGSALDVVHVLRGTYSTATGESFPLALRDRVRLVGEQGAGSTHIHGGLEVGVGSEPTGPETGAEGLTFVGVTQALTMETPLPDRPVRHATFRNLVIEGGTYGARVVTQGAASAGSSFVLEDSLVRAYFAPLQIMTSEDSRVVATLRGVRIEGFHNPLYVAASTGAEVDFLFERCSMRIDAPVSYGIRVVGNWNGGRARATFRDSEITSFCLSTHGLQADAETTIERCTITGHDTGLIVTRTLPLLLVDSIIYDNYYDLYAPPGTQAIVRNCLIDDPTHTGQNGNFSAPPLFVDPEGGNYDLRFGSPCIDRLPASAALDLRGRPRDVDGDLDTLTARDLGAIEMRTLDGPEHADLGAPIVLGVHGPAAQAAWLRISREAPLAAPLATPFGGLALRPGTMLPVALVPTSGELRTEVSFVAPTSSALAGSTVGYQALVRAPGAPAGAAYSNALGLTLH